jgi:hypothetical protein
MVWPAVLPHRYGLDQASTALFKIQEKGGGAEVLSWFQFVVGLAGPRKFDAPRLTVGNARSNPLPYTASVRKIIVVRS